MNVCVYTLRSLEFVICKRLRSIYYPYAISPIFLSQILNSSKFPAAKLSYNKCICANDSYLYMYISICQGTAVSILYRKARGARLDTLFCVRHQQGNALAKRISNDKL